MKCKNFLHFILLCVIIDKILVLDYYLSKKKGLRQVALEAILIAEEKWNTTTGKERLQIAVDYVYDYIPSYVKIFLSKELLNKILADFIQKVFDEVKKVLDFQKVEMLKGE